MEVSRDLLIAAVGIVGTALGAVIGAGGTWLIERQRQLHEERGRFSDQKRTAYERFDAAVEPLIALAEGVLENPASADTSALGPAERRILSALDSIKFISPVPVVSAALAVGKALADVGQALDRAARVPDDDVAKRDVSEALNAVQAARYQFVRAAREDIGAVGMWTRRA